MNRKLFATFFVVVAGVVAFAAWSLIPHAESGVKSGLTVFCAAGLKKPVEASAQQYRQEFGVEVALQYGATGTLLSQLQVAKQGDIFIATDDGSLADARNLKLIGEYVAIAVQHPVIAVKSGNPKGIRSLSDLTRADVRLAIANPGSASISKVSRMLLGTQWDGIAAKAAVMKPTVTEIAMDMQIGAVDAAIVWDSTVPQFKGLEAVELPEFTKHRENASAAVLVACKRPEEALKFARYLAAPDKGGKIFRMHGFQLAATARQP
uniref:Extracellular solute-binding protein n=1 Tax=uncultured Acidobacteria bacterium A11 TaxID=1036854 RepID=F8TTK2_9BACT|nr:extracellular solute-binding protein [uncultured Acidobacteria bacterium A11]